MTERIAMPKYLLLPLILLVCSACAQQQTPPAAAPEPKFETTATVRDIMDSIVDPSADVVWGAVETIVSAKGVEERFPRNDEEWLHVRRNAIMLIEASNLLKIPGRAVAKPGEKPENPGIELDPEQIHELIQKDRASWNNYAQALHDATVDALKSIDAKDAEGLLNMGDGIYQACEKCHMQYWYPDDKVPGAPTIQKGSN
jgi:hypothetical protein